MGHNGGGRKPMLSAQQAMWRNSSRSRPRVIKDPRERGLEQQFLDSKIEEPSSEEYSLTQRLVHRMCSTEDEVAVVTQRLGLPS